ncbi:DUF2316 family protein [Bifidobacterium breve]|nr:DUF2316 family protein [Bifidobacterium breve]
MSLNSEQRAATIREFQENMSRPGLTAERIGKDFASAAAEWSKSSPSSRACWSISGLSAPIC